PALDGDAVLGALELALQSQEILVRLELGVALDRHQKPRQRPGELVLRGLKPLERLGVVERLGRELDRGGAGARAGGFLQHRTLQSACPSTTPRLATRPRAPRTRSTTSRSRASTASGGRSSPASPSTRT